MRVARKINRPARQLDQAQIEAILKIANSVARRRRGLGISQSQLDREAGFTFKVAWQIERNHVDHRSKLPTHPYVRQILATLDRLESDPSFDPSRFVIRRNATSLGRRRPRKRPEARGAQTFSATLTNCPDLQVWTTQSGCDSVRRRDPICKGMRDGKGCLGVNHRKEDQLDTKTIEVRYSPPTPPAEWTGIVQPPGGPR